MARAPPAWQAHAFETQGFEYLHIVDLNGAFAGKPVNQAAVDRILETVACPVQLGSGLPQLIDSVSTMFSTFCTASVCTGARSSGFGGVVDVGFLAAHKLLMYDPGIETVAHTSFGV